MRTDLDNTSSLLVGSFSDLETLFKRTSPWAYADPLICCVKGSDYPVTDRSFDVQVVGLRKKLGDAGDFIETVRGVGYRFRE